VLALFAAEGVQGDLLHARLGGGTLSGADAADRGEAGMRLASHGWDHASGCSRSTPDQFRADLSRAQSAALEDASGDEGDGISRAELLDRPAARPGRMRYWRKKAIAYSSSVAPVKHDHYGWPDAPRGAFWPVPGADLIEIPITLARFLGREVATGGGFFRLLPGEVTYRAVRAANDAARPAIFYFHPWEIDPDQPRVQDAPFKSKLRHYSRLGAMAGKLGTLIAGHQWGRMDEVAAREAALLRKEKAK
jgi:polysaccharide deacetylase family protein (PEP-CTERM system associated)